jgi:hypothetical protein
MLAPSEQFSRPEQIRFDLTAEPRQKLIIGLGGQGFSFALDPRGGRLGGAIRIRSGRCAGGLGGNGGDAPCTNQPTCDETKFESLVTL